MTEIRVKDRLFMAVAIPALVAAVYWFGWRADTGKQIDALRQRRTMLVAEEDFDLEIARARRALDEAAAELKAESEIPLPAAKVRGDAAASEAEREREVIGVFRAAGLRVVRSETADKPGDTVAGAMLRDAGVCARPVCRVYSLEGSYPSVEAALAEFGSRLSAVIPASVEMTTPGHWQITLNL